MDPLFEPEMQPTPSLWNYLRWSPTSLLKSQTAEHRLLSRMPFFKSHIGGLYGQVYVDDAYRVKGFKDGDITPQPVVNLIDPLIDTTKEINRETPVRDRETNNRSQSTARIGLINIGNDRLINTLIIDTPSSNSSSSTPTTQTPTTQTTTSTTKTTQSTLVMTHGYAAGLGFYYRCFPGLSQMNSKYA